MQWLVTLFYKAMKLEVVKTGVIKYSKDSVDAVNFCQCNKQQAVDSNTKSPVELY